MNHLALKRIYQHNDFLKKTYKTYALFFQNISLQKGGGYNVLYKNKKIYFESLIEDNERLKIFLTSSANDDTCIMVIIDKSDKLAYIESLTNNKDNKCFDTPELNKGFNIMEITIKMLKKYKEKLTINVIQLKDNSFIYCDNKTKTWLSSLSFLQYNNTFYGRFNFIPKDKDMYEKYLRNQFILDETLTKKINIEKLMTKFNKKIYNKENIMKYYNKYKESNITKWFNKISHKYMQSDCEFFNYLIDSIFQDLKLEKFLHISFILKL